MSWQSTMTAMLRVLINDLDCRTFTDGRLEQVLAVAAKYVQQDLVLDNVYTIDVEIPDITPDPTEINDSAYVNFVVLKAACISDQGVYRTKAVIEGVKASLGPAALSVGGNLKGFQTLLEKGPCATYEQMKQEYNFGNSNIVAAVLSPFSGNNFDPTSLGFYTYREGYNNG